MQRLIETTSTASAIYPINFTQPNKRFALSVQYNGSNSFLFVNAKKIYHFKAKDSEIKDYALCLGNISKDFPINNMKKTGLKGVAKFFSVDFNPVDPSDALDIRTYLMKGKQYKIMFGLFKKMFMGLLLSIVNKSNHTKCVLLSNQKCMTQPTLITLHPNEHGQEFHYNSFAVKFGICVGSCNIPNDLSDKVCLPNKTKDLNLSMFNIITGMNESKTLIKHISRECKCKLDRRKCISDQWQNNDKCLCECKKRHVR